MVVISASICTKSGKILLARQFVGINRLKLEEYMANFPKLIDSGKVYIKVTPFRQTMHAH
jgi:coatomer subunit delta